MLRIEPRALYLVKVTPYYCDMSSVPLPTPIYIQGCQVQKALDTCRCLFEFPSHSIIGSNCFLTVKIAAQRPHSPPHMCVSWWTSRASSGGTAIYSEAELAGKGSATHLCLCLLLSLAYDQTPCQAAGLRARGREGCQRACLLQENRLGETGEQGDPTTIQAQSGESRKADQYPELCDPDPGHGCPFPFSGR